VIVTEICNFDSNIYNFSEEETTPHTSPHPSISATDTVEGLLKVTDSYEQYTMC